MNRIVWTLSLQCQESASQNYTTMCETATELGYGREKGVRAASVNPWEMHCRAQVIGNGSLPRLYVQHVNTQKEPSSCLLHLLCYVKMALLCWGSRSTHTAAGAG